MIGRQPLKSILLFLLLFLPVALSAESSEIVNRLVIADFDTEDMLQHTDAWEHNILDDSQSIKVQLIDEDALGKSIGKALRLKFDVLSSRPAMVGFVVRLQRHNLTDFDMLHISLKSGEETRFTGNIALQFIDQNNRRAPYLISKVSKEWKEYQVPLHKFRRIGDWSEIKEFELIIDDINARPKEGVLFVDEIYVSDSKED